MERGFAQEGEGLTLAVDAQTVRVVQAFRRAGIEPILLKGPAVASWLYAGDMHRSYRDTDLMVDPGVREPAFRALRSLGYGRRPDPRGPAVSSTTWLRQGMAVEVDLHTAIWGWGRPEMTWVALQGHTESIRLGPVDVTVMDEYLKWTVPA